MAKTLKDHEELCSIRYENIERRLVSIEANIDEIHREIDGFKNFILGLAVKCAMGVFAIVCGAVFVIKM
jgi:ribulose 1,5-bisphosphate carboxylase large subunit-like protein